MTIFSRCSPKFFPAAVVWALVVMGILFRPSGEARGEDETGGREVLTEIPGQFFQVQDSSGYFWQAVSNGALTSGGTQYLQSGLNLLVNGEVFSPEEGEMRAPGREGDSGSANLVPSPSRSEIELRESRGDYTLRRNLLFDRERSAVRVLDQFTNTSSGDLSLKVALRTTYPFGWQSLHDLDGRLLASDPVLNLGEGGNGIVVRFSAAEGRHDTVLITGPGGETAPAAVTASTNQRELTLTYELELAAGESRTLLHWISQRNLPEMNEVAGQFDDLLQRGRLVRPGLSAAQGGEVANFPASAIPEESGAPAQLRAMIALNREIDRIGLHRRAVDLLWVSSTNQMAGTVEAEGTIRILAGHIGTMDVPFANVAAIIGGAGVGRQPRLFLRDGRVVRGAISIEGLSLRPLGGGEALPLDPEKLNLLLLRTGPVDGIPPDGAGAFLRLIDGTVVALSGEKSFDLEVGFPWGTETVSSSRILELGYVSRPFPAHRIITDDGLNFSVFLKSSPLSLELAGGKKLEVSAGMIDRLWRVGSRSLLIDFVEEAWLDFSEVPVEQSLETGFLLTGNQLLAGTFAASSLQLIDAGGRVDVPTGQIASLHRLIDSPSGSRSVYQVELDSGEVFEGQLNAPLLEIRRGDRTIPIPALHILAFRAEFSGEPLP